MSQETQRCPACQGVMHYRLGEFECDSCGLRISAAEQREALTQTTGQRAPLQWESPSQRRFVDREHTARVLAQSQPPPPAAGEERPLEKQLRDQPKYAIIGNLMARGGTADPYPLLQIEKHMFMGVAGALVLAQLAYNFFHNAYQSELWGLPFWYVVGGSLALELALYAYALYGPHAWIKWSCLALTVVLVAGSLLAAAGSLAGGALRDELEFRYGEGGPLMLILGVVLFIGLWCWFALILWRDLQRLAVRG